MGEKPVASCRAHVFFVEPPSKKWSRVGNATSAIGLYYHSTKRTYRIIGYYGEKGDQKVVLNSYITHATVFRKASAKFFQWTNPSTRQLCGLTFPTPEDGAKFAGYVNEVIKKLKIAKEAEGGGDDEEEEAPPTPARRGNRSTKGKGDSDDTGAAAADTSTDAADEKTNESSEPAADAAATADEDAGEGGDGTADDGESGAATETDEKPLNAAKAALGDKEMKRIPSVGVIGELAEALPDNVVPDSPAVGRTKKRLKRAAASKGKWEKFKKRGVAVADYTPPEGSEHFIGLSMGGPVLITERIENWYRGTNLATEETGVFPANFVHLQEADDSDRVVMNEMARQMEEWKDYAVSMFKARQINRFSEAVAKFDELRSSREQIFVMSSRNAQDSLSQVRSRGIRLVEHGRRQLGFEIMALTKDGEVADHENTGIAALLPLYMEVDPSDMEPIIGVSSKKKQLVSRDSQARLASSGAMSPALTGTIVGNLAVQWKSFICPVGPAGEETELYFSIYSQASGDFISAEYVMRLNGAGQPVDENNVMIDVEEDSQFKFIFTNLSPADLDSQLALVCRVVRKGKMLNDDSKQKTTERFRRMFGYGVLPLTSELLKPKSAITEHTLRVYQTPAKVNMDFNLHENILNEATGSFVEVPHSHGVTVSVQFTSGTFDPSTYVVRGLTAPMAIPKLTFPEIVMPGEDRNELYIRLDGADISKDCRNAEIQIRVVDPSGNIVENCFTSEGQEPVSIFRSTVNYHEQKPRFNELITLRVTRDQADDCHLYITVRQCSTSEDGEKVMAFTWLPLTNENGTMLEDGPKDLPLYKYLTDKKGKPIVDSPTWYLTETDPKKLAVRKGDFVHLRTNLTSTLLTQVIELYNLLHWRSASEPLTSILNIFLYVHKNELVKFFRDIFNALFNILDAHDEVAVQVYDALVFLVNSLTDERGVNSSELRAVLDLYIERHFQGMNAHRPLVAALKGYLTDPEQNGKQVRSSVKALEYTFKLIVRSRLLYIEKMGDDNADEFRAEMEELFQAMDALMSKDMPALIGVQTLALRTFKNLFDDLPQIFEYDWVAGIVTKFVDSVNCRGQKKLEEEKLGFLTSLAEGDLFLLDETRPIILPPILRDAVEALSSGDEFSLRMALPIVAGVCNQVVGMLPEDRVSVVSDLVVFVEPLQNAILATHAAMTGDDDEAGEQTSGGRQPSCLMATLVSCLLSLYDHMQTDHFVEIYKGTEDKAGYLKLTFRVLYTIITTAVYPESWFTMHIIKHHVLCKVLSEFNGYLCDDFADGEPTETGGFQFQLWTMYFRLLVINMCEPPLQLEDQPAMNVVRVMEKFGDMRLPASELLARTWVFLCDKQTHFIPSLVGSLLSLMVVKEPTVALGAMGIYFSMLELDYKENGNLRTMELETIDMFNNMTTAGTSDQRFAAFYKDALWEKIEGIADENFKKLVVNYHGNMKQLFSHSLELASLDQSALFDDDRIFAMTKLMDYLLSIDREAAYIRLAHELVGLHTRNGCFGEAGYATLLHANLLEFSEDVLPPIVDFPEQTSRLRKVALYHSALELLEQGKMWERAVELCCELREQYRDFLFDYMKYAEISSKEAELYRLMATAERLPTFFYRVGYYGKPFPDSVRNKEFIFRGGELEQLSTFQAKFTQKYPGLEFLPSKADPLEAGCDVADAYFIQVAKFEPKVNEDAIPTSPAAVAPDHIKTYLTQNRVSEFRMSRPLKKEGVVKNKENEFATLWLLETVVRTENEFPFFQRRSEVASKEELELSPIVNAEGTVIEKNKEIREMYAKFSLPHDNPSPFTMCLNGCIMAFVNGGAEMYVDAFLNEAYLSANPDDVSIADSIKNELIEQVELLGKGLELHGKIVQSDMRALHGELETQYEKMRAGLLATLNVEVEAIA